MTLSEKQIALLRRLAETDGPETNLYFGSGTLSSCRKAGLIERLRITSRFTVAKSKTVVAYQITEAGRAALREGTSS